MEKRKSERMDMSKYIGARKSDGSDYKIMSAIVQKHEKFGYGVKLTTEAIQLTTEDDVKLGGKKITASVIFKLGFDEVKKELFVVEDSKLDKFLISKNIDVERIPSTAKKGDELDLFWGIPVKIQMKENGFLTFV